MKIPRCKFRTPHFQAIRSWSGPLRAGAVFATLGLAVSSFCAEALTEFNFNEGAGTSVTSVDGKLVGTFVGNPVFSTDTPSGLAGDYSIQFTAGQKISVPDPDQLLSLDRANPSFTIQAWLKFTTPGARSVFFYNQCGGGRVSASVNTDRSAFVTTLGIVDQPSKAVIPDDGGWHHMAVVHENQKEFRFYIDGQLADTVPYTRSVSFNATNRVFFIGGESSTAYPYAGLLDRLRYHKGILTPEQLDAKRIPADARPAGAAFAPPSGGWTYIYNGDKDAPGDDEFGFTSLDGVWSHMNGSDQFDGSKIGGEFSSGSAFGEGNAPGGVMSITEQGVTYLRMQDAGNPASGSFGFPDPYSNRKIYFGRDLMADAVPDALLDEGVTLSFRARVPTPAKTTGPLDAIYADGQSAAGPRPYPAGGDGYLISDGGKGNVGIKQLNGGIISFALTVPADTFTGDPSGTRANFSGLTMNKFNGASVTSAVNFDSPGEFRGVELDSTEWHEFWITIKADASGNGTHEVAVYLDGSASARTNFVVTAGNGDDFPGIPYLTIGGSRTVESWALDLDFVAYKIGAEAPVSIEPLRFTSIVRQGDKAVITWTGGGTLQHSTDGTPNSWSDLTGVNSPATVSISEAKRFYRARK